MRGKTRMMWHRTVQQWHWVSAAICLAALLLFSITGITLNHADAIRVKAKVENQTAVLPAPLLAQLAEHGSEDRALLPQPVREWLEQQFDIDAARGAVEWSDDEVLVSAPGAGRDTWASIDRASGDVEFETTWRGVIAWANDLHKGRNTGGLWQGFIDLVAAACLIFAVTGLFLLQLQARQRPRTWPVVGAGVVLLFVMMIAFAH